MSRTRRPLRVAMVGTSDVAGEAERFAERLAAALRDRGHRCHRFVGLRSSRAADVRLLDNTARRRHPIGWCSVALERATGLHYLYYPGTRDLLRALRGYDVLHLHNLHGGYLSPRMLPVLSHAATTVITLHDCYLMTGHCAYPMDCERWHRGCGDCPDLQRYPSMRRDATRAQRALLHSWIAQSRLSVVAPSRWMADQWESAGMPGPRPTVIPNGFDLARYSPGDRAAARHALGIADSDHAVLFAAQGGISSPYKDGDTIVRAIRHLLRTRTAANLRYIILGGGRIPEDLRARAIAPGFVADETALAQYYRAADLMLFATRADNAPLVLAEAQACGTPVVATSVGGVPELIEHGTTGYLVEQGDAKALSERATSILENPALRQSMSQAARALTVRGFDEGQVVEQYVDLYHSSSVAGAG